MEGRITPEGAEKIDESSFHGIAGFQGLGKSAFFDN